MKFDIFRTLPKHRNFSEFFRKQEFLQIISKVLLKMIYILCILKFFQFELNLHTFGFTAKLGKIYIYIYKHDAKEFFSTC